MNTGLQHVESLLLAYQCLQGKSPVLPDIPTHDELGNRWISKHPHRVFGLGSWWDYDQGVYHRIDASVVRAEILDEILACKLWGIRPSSSLLYSVTDLARVKLSVPEPRWNADPNLIVCQNGTLDLRTRSLRAHSPGDYITAGLPFGYDPQAPAHLWNHVLETRIPEAKEFLQEFAGYTLTTDTRFELAVCLYGPEGSGKSTIIGGIAAVHGSRVAVLRLPQLERSNFLAELLGKTLLAGTELPPPFIRSEHLLNALISGVPITIQKRGHGLSTFVPHAKLLWSINELPRMSETNSGLFRRVQWIRFPELATDQRNPTIKEAVKNEAAGILNWALEGLERLTRRGNFDIPRYVRSATNDLERQNDLPQLFVDECCTRGQDDKTQAQALYNAYQNWCRANGHPAQSSGSVAGDWLRLGFERYRRRGKTYYRGLRLQ
jgi:putative DNA primase/helicase